MSHSIVLMSMVLVFVTVAAMAFPYPEDVPVVLADEAPTIDDVQLPLGEGAEGDETVDARHHYNSYNRRPAAYYNRPSYSRPTYTRPSYNRPAAAYNNRPLSYGTAGQHGGYNHYSGHQSSNYYGSNTGYTSHHGSQFGGLGWREGEKKTGDAANPSDEIPVVPEIPAVQGDDEPGVVFQ